MKPIYLLALLLAHTGAHAAAPAAAKSKGPAFGGYKCDSVLKSAVNDLRGFCEAEPFNKRRLVDYGYQLDIIEAGCSNKEDAAEIIKALNAKVHKQDERACLDVADKLAHDISRR